TIGRLDSNWGRSPEAKKKLTLGALLEKYGKSEKTLSNKTLNRYCDYLQALFRWAFQRGHYHSNANPFAEQRREAGKAEGWLPYTIAELNLLFASQAFKVDLAERVKPKAHGFESALRWVAPIALFSGMRLTEIAQLRVADVDVKARTLRVH